MNLRIIPRFKEEAYFNKSDSAIKQNSFPLATLSYLIHNKAEIFKDSQLMPCSKPFLVRKKK